MPRGFSTAGDVVTTTIDGVDLNQVWTEFQASIELQNQRRSAIAALFTFSTTQPADLVPQATARDDFEEASEFGEPKGLRLGPDTLQLGFMRKDYDAATRFTARYLRDATAAQVESVHNLALAADNRLVFRDVMNTIFSPSQRLNDEGIPVYGLWSGDGMVPPDYASNTFDGTHTHYLTSGAAVIDSGDVEALIDTVQHHGYGTGVGDRLILLCNPVEGRKVRKWRSNVANDNGQVADYDFIPSESAPAYLTPETIVGDVAPGDFQGLPLIGSYGPAWICEDGYIPAGYVVLAATGGQGSPLNPVGFREHPNAAYRGLRLIPGPNPSYPLSWSFYTRTFGTGVRNRGAAAVMRITTSPTYAAPVIA
jgi:hypothetical protein